MHTGEHTTHTIGSHFLWQVGDITFHADTLIMTWLTMLVLTIISLYFYKNLLQKPSKAQIVLESTILFVEDLVSGQIGKKYALKYLPLIGTIFLFVLFANLLGLLPWRILNLFGFHMELAAPTNDLNTTGALAIIALIAYLYSGIKKKGWGYFKHYVKPFWFFLPLNILEDITRPLSLMFRLFGNIMGGEIVIAVLLTLLPWFIPVFVFGLEFFVAFIQAFIFAVLTAFYIGSAIADEH